MSVDSAQELYGLPIDQFIAERAALVKALRAEKRRETANEVAALRKPSVAAWAVNQIVRTQAFPVQALFAAGDDLARAQAEAGAGRPAGDAMRDATRRQREAIGDLVRAAEGLLSSEGHPLSQTTLERVADTFRAAAINDHARQEVKSGCLARELQFVGLGMGAETVSLPQISPGARNQKPKTPPASRRTAPDDGVEDKPVRQVDTADPAEIAAKAEARHQRNAAIKAARQAETDARQRAARTAKELAAAQARREKAAASLGEAELRVTVAERLAHEAAAELANAEQVLRHLAGA